MFICVCENGDTKKELINVNKNMEEMQRVELEAYLLTELGLHRLRGLPADCVYDMMLRIGLGSWFNLLFVVLRDTGVKYRGED